MNATRIAILGILVSALAAGIALYYLQVYAYYTEVTAEEAPIELTSIFTGQPELIEVSGFNAIDSDSSPIRFRACFQTPLSLGMLTETYQLVDGAEPLVAPSWFECYDAKQIGDDLTSGVAVAFLGHANIHYGVDRIVAVYPDGRAFAWHQINVCGEEAFNGRPVPEGCPPVPERLQ